MTVIDVDTDVYTQSARALITAATDWFAAVDGRWNTLADCGSMCGSYEEARTWAAGYDTKAEELITTARMIAEAATSYGSTLLELGYLHAVADHNANMTPGPPPSEPAYPNAALVSLQCRAALPSAGGPGNGLEEIAGQAIGLLEEIGIVVPDGDTTKLGVAADAWAQIAAAPEVTGFVAELDRITALFEPITAPELVHIEEDLKALRTAAADAQAGFGELSATTTEHRAALVEMRDGLRGLLEQLAKDIALEIAITATISIAASFVTFGAAGAGGAAIAAARVAHIVGRYGPKIRPVIAVFKSKGLARGVAKVHDFSNHKKEMQRLLDMEARKGPRPKGSSWDAPISPETKALLEQGPYNGRNGENLDELLRSGKPLTPEQQQRVKDLDAALDGLPTHQGPVVRHKDLTPEELARYEPGKPVTENGYTATSTRPDGTNPAFSQSKAVEFQIVSKNGHPVGEYTGLDDEVLFKSGTPFFVQNKFYDPKTDKVIIQMTEI